MMVKNEENIESIIMLMGGVYHAGTYRIGNWKSMPIVIGNEL